MRPYELELSDAARAELVRHRDTDRRPCLREVCAALLKRADVPTARRPTRRGSTRSRSCGGGGSRDCFRHRRADDWDGLKARIAAFLDRFAQGSDDPPRYVGLWSD